MLHDLREDDEVKATVLDGNILQIADISRRGISLLAYLLEVRRLVPGMLVEIAIGRLACPGVQDQGAVGDFCGERLILLLEAVAG